MKRKNYIERLKARGYKILNETQVALGTLVFDINESMVETAVGVQNTFYLKISPVH